MVIVREVCLPGGGSMALPANLTLEAGMGDSNTPPSTMPRLGRSPMPGSLGGYGGKGSLPGPAATPGLLPQAPLLQRPALYHQVVLKS